MYKSNLQELCQKNRWALPIYSGMKDGLEHNPKFIASVVVNGTNFDTLNICKSLKEAHNEAAKLAFFHFSSDGESTQGGANAEQAAKASEIQTIKDDHELADARAKIKQAVKGVSIKASTSSFEDGSLNMSAEIDAEEQKSDRIQKIPEIQTDSLDMEHDLKQKFKTKLQIYAQRNNLGLPFYYSTREGPPNSLCFRTTVTVGGDSFNSPGRYKTIKQAEDVAAQVALMALSVDAFQENDIRLYKNLLQEFARGEGFFMPQYKTTRTGEAHDPTFNAMVEVEGVSFHGNPAKSKKEAELSAAKVAYTNFVLRKYCQTCDFSSSSSKDEVLELASCLNLLAHADVIVNQKSESPTLLAPAARYDVQAEVDKDGDEETVSSESLQAKTRFEMEAAISVPSDTDEDEKAVLNTNIPDENKFKTKENVPVSYCKDSSVMKMATDTNSYLLNDRIRVYTYIPDVASTKDNVVLPIGEGEWVVVSLEFPE